MPNICNSPGHWREVRRLLNSRRHELTALAAELYPMAHRVGSTRLLCQPSWLPDEPLDLDAIALSWLDGAPPAPAPPEGASYAEALAAIERPALLENRVTYRLLAADLAGPPAGLTLTRGRYFDWVNTGEAVAHELAGAWLEDQILFSTERLRLRTLIGDPCDLGRRSALCAVTTLTLRIPAAGEPTFLLHWRDPALVTHAGGLYQVMPAGIFQPTAGSAAAESGDLDLWRCMAREFSEEFLGTPDGYGRAVDYGNWAFYRELSAARAAGKVRVSCLGLGTDPLTLATDLLTVAAFAGDVFDELFGGLVESNEEGRVVSMAGVPFSAETVDRFTGGTERMQAAGAAVLELAWRHRRQLLL
ncbi:MAG TPA: hypothetical protein VGI74_11235 [Streptosporangiaceae bacterium]